MKNNLLKIGAAIGLSASLLGASVASAETSHINAVGTWSSLSNFVKHEKPFWTDQVSGKTDGEVTGSIKSLSELGLKGFEIMRLLKVGVFDYAHGLPGYVAAENAIFEGADLSALTQDIATQRKVSDAYFPILEKSFEEIFGVKLLQLYPFPSQMLWCNKEVNNINDLTGKKIRVYSTTLGDFVEGAGGTSVTVPFGEVIPALEKGVVDCAITGTMSAYSAKWYQVAKYAYTLRVGWGLSFGAMNMKKWNSLTEDTQAKLKSAIEEMNDNMWAETENEDTVAIACLTGSECYIGETGGMKLVEPSADDLKGRDIIAKDFVLKKWAERCGEECAAGWNSSVGAILNMTASAK